MKKPILSLGRKRGGTSKPRRNKITPNSVGRITTAQATPTAVRKPTPHQERAQDLMVRNKARDTLEIDQRLGYGEPSDLESALSSGDVVMASRFSNTGDGSALKAIGAKVRANQRLTPKEEAVYNQVASVGNAANIISNMSTSISASATPARELEEGEQSYEEQMGFDSAPDYGADDGLNITGMVKRVLGGDTDINPQIQGHAQFSDIEKEFQGAGGEWVTEMYDSLAATYQNQEDPGAWQSQRDLARRLQTELPAVLRGMPDVFAAQGSANAERRANGLQEVTRGWGQALDLMGLPQGDPKRDKATYKARGGLVKGIAQIMNLTGSAESKNRRREAGMGLSPAPAVSAHSTSHLMDDVAQVTDMDEVAIDGDTGEGRSAFSTNLAEALDMGFQGGGDYVRDQEFQDANVRTSDGLGLSPIGPLRNFMENAMESAKPSGALVRGLARLNQDVLDKRELNGGEWIKGVVPTSPETRAHTLQSRMNNENVSISSVEPGTPEWLAGRVNRTTAADAKYALGVDKEGNSTGKLDKVGERMGVPQDTIIKNPNIDRGHAREPKIADWYAKEYGVELAEPGMLTNDLHPGLGASLDRMVVGGKDVGEFITRGVEIKSVNQFRKKSDFNDQVQMQMALSGFKDMDLVQEKLDYDHPNADGSPRADYQVDRIVADAAWQRRKLPEIKQRQKDMVESEDILQTTKDMVAGGSSDEEIGKYLKDSIKKAHYELLFENAPSLGDRGATLVEEAVEGAKSADASAKAYGEHQVRAQKAQGAAMAKDIIDEEAATRRSEEALASAMNNDRRKERKAERSHEEALASAMNNDRRKERKAERSHEEALGGAMARDLVEEQRLEAAKQAEVDGRPSRFLAQLNRGLQTGTVGGLGGGVVDAIREVGPIGRTIAGIIDLGKVSYNAMDITRERINAASSVGMTGAAFTESLHQLKSDGMSKANAAGFINQSQGAASDMSIGNYDQALQIVQGSRGLISFDDVAESSPEELNALFKKRTAHLTDQQRAGMERATGLTGAATTASDTPEVKGLKTVAGILEEINVDTLAMKASLATLAGVGGEVTVAKTEEEDYPPYLTGTTSRAPEMPLGGSGGGSSYGMRSAPKSVQLKYIADKKARDAKLAAAAEAYKVEGKGISGLINFGIPGGAVSTAPTHTSTPTAQDKITIEVHNKQTTVETHQNNMKEKVMINHGNAINEKF